MAGDAYSAKVRRLQQLRAYGMWFVTFAGMAGIYVHIPFCRKACHYCNFHFSTSFNTKDELVDALIREIQLQTRYLKGHRIETIYFGGGTPSALPHQDIHQILSTIQSNYKVEPQTEITLEANPEDITSENLEAWKVSGINRLSIGVQAFQDDLLQKWNRNHLAQKSIDSILLAQAAGFENISADLIYGGDGLNDEEWIGNIQKIINFKIPHISAYALTVEPGTVLAHQVQKGRSIPPDDEQSNRQYQILQKMLGENGYQQYEISNFALPGKESRHNTSYWKGIPYLGIGPSAHSFNGVSRQWNVSHNIKYTHALRNDTIPFEIETLTPQQRYNEIVMTGLRTAKGIEKDAVEGLDSSFSQKLNLAILPYLENGKVFKNGDGNYALNPEYYFFADGIAAELFF
ncbi:MAG: radical SAM family heme chaperone HemW [Bacteroidota bacterium]|nr:radical SAM family heme chaperone HemW [Bacteroidota bacterium]